VNRTGPYEYLSYEFSNKSKDIVELFTTTCAIVGVEHRVNGWEDRWHVRINRPGSVKSMLANVGIKS
jgi:hypothetical protein